MIKNKLLGMILCLGVSIMIFPQGSSCQKTKTRRNTSIDSSSSTDISTSPQKTPDSILGRWGGQHISLEINEQGANIEFDCAHGTLTEKIVPDRDGKFVVKGTFVTEGPGPTRKGEDTGEPATYEGSVTNGFMTLTVSLTKTKEAMGTFTLSKGRAGRIRKCA